MTHGVESVKRHFSRCAENYHLLSSVQAEAAEQLARDYLKDLSARRILEIGCGSGYLTGHLAGRFPAAQIDAVDLSPEMLAVAKANLDAANINFIEADICEFSAAQRYDLIVSSSALQWLPLDAKMFEKFSTLLVPDGNVVFSAMLAGTLGELHALRREIAPAKAPKRNLPQSADILSAAQAAGFTIHANETVTREEEFDDAQHFFSEIRARGFTGGELSQGQKVLGAKELQRLLDEYQARHQSLSGVSASYVIGFFHLMKGANS